QDSVQVYIDGEFAGKAPGKIKVDSRLIQHGSVLTLKSEGTPGQVIKEQIIISTFVLLSILLWGSEMLNAQEISHFTPNQFKEDASSGHYHYWEVKLHSGSHPNTSKYIEELLAGGYRAVEVRIGTQSTGRQVWQRAHNYPQYGVGFYLANLGPNQLDTIVGYTFGIVWLYRPSCLAQGNIPVKYRSIGWPILRF
ncbi:MAG: hypothetical protein K8S16_19090, partial [Bacteroidales bacterium]|nr:hypothetical protein [Bacteroidales bacterium]